MDRKKLLPAVALLVFIIVLTAIIKNNTPSKVSAGPSSQVTLPSSTKKDINRDFTVSNLKYTLVSGELTDQILVNGQKATAVSGKTFLIINIKLTNDSNNKATINTRDYIRLSTGSDSEWLAPDIHNDPVEVQPISTKYTRLGFPVDSNVKNFKVRVGEINGDKTTLDLTF
jgi:hypothetical protein